jgi:hypothetical protein
MNTFIGIAGNIGAGKTTAGRVLRERLSIGRSVPYRMFEEEVKDNPYLEPFYEDPERWSFKLQVFFLESRILMHDKSQAGQQPCILDRTIYEDREVFAQHQINTRLWTPDETAWYLAAYYLFMQRLAPPTLLIYLDATIPTLRERIRERARPYEASMVEPQDKRLPAYQQLYHAWIRRYDLSPVIRIRVDGRNFHQEESSDRDWLADRVKRELRRIQRERPRGEGAGIS